MADIAVINKVDSAEPSKVEEVRKNIETHNPKAEILLADSAILVEGADQIKGKRVLVVEDGPTLTHGEMMYGAGVIAAQRYGAANLVDPRPFITGKIKETTTFDASDFRNIVPRFTPEARRANQALVELKSGKIRGAKVLLIA